MPRDDAEEPFSLDRYRVTPSVELVVLDPKEDAPEAGSLLSAMEPWASYPIGEDDLTAFLVRVEPGAPRYKIVHGGILAGALAVRQNWLCGTYIQLIGLAPMSHNRGFGTAILKFVEEQARLGGDANLWVCVSDFNTDAQRFYERFGFVRKADFEDLVRDGRTEILMRKRLDVAGA